VQETLHFLDAQYEVIKKEKNIHLDIIKIVKELKKLNKELTGVFNDIAKDNPSLPVLPKPVLLHSASTSQLKTEPAASGSEPPKGSYLKRGSTYVGSMLTFRGSKAREDSKKDLKAFANESTPRSTSFAAPSDQKKEKERKPSDAGADLSESDKKLKRTTSTASVSGSKIVNLSDRDKEKKPSRSLSQRVLSIVRSDPPEKDPKQNPDDNSGEPTPPSSSPSGKKGS
jgi:hypothetical protein